MKMQEFLIRQANEADAEAIAWVIDQIKQGMKQPEWFVAGDRTYVERHISAQGLRWWRKQCRGETVVLWPHLW